MTISCASPPSPFEFRLAMRQIYSDSNSYDMEIAHEEADRLMCETLQALGYDEGVAIFEQAEKWYA